MALIPSIETQVRAMFPEAPLRVPVSRELWQGRVFSVYLRNSGKVIDGKIFHSIVVAKVDLSPAKAGVGYFRELCTFVETFAVSHPFIQAIFHECVLNPDVAAMHLRHGYLEIPHSEGFPSSDFVKWAKPSPVTLSEQRSQLENSVENQL